MEEIEWKFNPAYYPISIVTFFVYLAVQEYGNPAIAKRYCPKVLQMEMGRQVYWYSSMSSTYNAVLSGILCLLAMYYEDFSIDPIWHDSVIVKSSCAMVVGYLAADTLVMFVNFKHMADIVVFLHHAASIYAYFYVMTYGTYVYFANYRLMAELSTPWVNNRWFLDVYGFNKTGKFYFWNGIILTAVFVGCRVLTIPWYWYRVYDIYGTAAYIRTGNVKYVLFSSCIVLDILNLLWTYKLLRGVRKTLKMKYDTNKNITAEKTE